MVKRKKEILPVLSRNKFKFSDIYRPGIFTPFARTFQFEDDDMELNVHWIFKNERLDFSECHYDPTQEIEDAIDAEYVEKTVDKVLSKLKPRHEQIVRLYLYDEDKSLAYVGKQLGITRNMVWCHFNRAMRDMRQPNKTVLLKPILEYFKINVAISQAVW